MKGVVARSVEGEQQGTLLLANLSTIAAELDRGAIAIFHSDRLRVRKLPLHRRDP
jgi:hypothetical protein